MKNSYKYTKTTISLINSGGNSRLLVSEMKARFFVILDIPYVWLKH